ncbi:MAG: hypothetical protein OEY63_06050 [Gemmatimonadota bacterium]|nr:hypothetical protein [Gemmatimonadota bacterium]MDH5805938.1 hypothetical protein [Gemmatimonadota bacterium]
MKRVCMKMMLLVALFIAPSQLTAQEGMTGSISILGMQTAFERLDSAGLAQGMDGMYFGAEGRFRFWKSSIGVRFLKGSLTQIGQTTAESVTEMVVTFGSQPAEWITFLAGPHMRSYQTETGPLNSTLWEGQIRIENRLVGRSLRSYIDMWRTFATNEDFSTLLGTGQGVEGGLIIIIPNIHLMIQLGYRVDRSKIPESVVRHTSEALFFALGFGGR